jgi:hypothetical protein
MLLADFSTLKMEAIRYPETSVHTRSTRRHIPGNGILPNMDIVSHPPYSPDLAPCDFSLFPKLKMKLKGRHFESHAVLDSIKENYLHGAFEAWKKTMDHCVLSQGNYFEGDGSQI